MCKHGNTVLMPIAGRVRNIDTCIHDIVAALNAAGIVTTACCCGHGKHVGSILLADGRVVEIYPDRDKWQTHRKRNPATLSGEVLESATESPGVTLDPSSKSVFHKPKNIRPPVILANGGKVEGVHG